MTPVYTCQESKCYNFEMNSSLRVVRDRHLLILNFVGGKPKERVTLSAMTVFRMPRNGVIWSHFFPQDRWHCDSCHSWVTPAENVTRNFDSQRWPSLLLVLCPTVHDELTLILWVKTQRVRWCEIWVNCCLVLLGNANGCVPCAAALSFQHLWCCSVTKLRCLKNANV